MRYIAASVQQLNRLCNRIFFVKFNSQDAFLCLPIMDDADIFDADVVQRQKRGDGGDRTCFIRDIQTDRVILFDRAASGVDKGIAVCACTVKKGIERGRIVFLQLFLNDAKGVDIILQQSGNIDSAPT